ADNMLVFRVTHTKYAEDTQGMGAKLFGGRWNHRGISCLYASSNRALAILEYSANTPVDLIPRALSIVTYEIEEHCIKSIAASQLPGDWKTAPAPISTKSFGTELLSAEEFIIKIPSCIVPQEYNFILPPALFSNEKI